MKEPQSLRHNTEGHPTECHHWANISMKKKNFYCHTTTIHSLSITTAHITLLIHMKMNYPCLLFSAFRCFDICSLVYPGGSVSSRVGQFLEMTKYWPRRMFFRSKPTIPELSPQLSSLSGSHTLGYYPPALITLRPDTRQLGTAPMA